MDLRDVMRTTGATRSFRDDDVSLEVIWELLDDARFAPNGANRQPWSVVVVRDAGLRARMRDLYLERWREYVALRTAGLRPFSPSNDPEAERAVIASDDSGDVDPASFASTLDTVPVLLAVFVDLSELAAVDKSLGRYSIAGGASIYPFVHNILLAARARGLGGVMTTLLQRSEPEVLAALHAPPNTALAAVVALGRPSRPTARLRRRPVSDFTTLDTCTGPALEPARTSAREHP